MINLKRVSAFLILVSCFKLNAQWHLVENFDWQEKQVTVLFHDYLNAYSKMDSSHLKELMVTKNNWEALDSFRIMRPSFLFEIYDPSGTYTYFVVRPRREGDIPKDFLEYLKLDYKTSPLQFMEAREARPIHRFRDAPLLNDQMYYFKDVKIPAFQRERDGRIFPIYKWSHLKQRYFSAVEEFLADQSDK